MSEEVYLGDGLYASFDGGVFKLRAPRFDGDHWVALDGCWARSTPTAGTSATSHATDRDHSAISSSSRVTSDTSGDLLRACGKSFKPDDDVISDGRARQLPSRLLPHRYAGDGAAENHGC